MLKISNSFDLCNASIKTGLSTGRKERKKTKAIHAEDFLNDDANILTFGNKFHDCSMSNALSLFKY